MTLPLDVWPVGVPWWVVPVVLAALVLVVGPLRRFMWRCGHAVNVRARWHTHVGQLGLVRGDSRATPKILRVRPDAVGDWLRLQLPPGGSVSRLEARADEIAAAMAVGEVRVAPDPRNASSPTVMLVRRDPLADAGVLAWPLEHAGSWSLWDPVPVAMDAHGNTVTLRLPERNLLLGGEPGGGKSAALSLPVAAAALDPHVRLHLLDGKLVELAAWTGVADSSVGVDIDEAIGLLDHLRGVMDRRYEHLLANRARKIDPVAGMPLHVVVCDELAYYITAGDRKQTKGFADGMRDLVSRGRAAGIIVLAATQKPASDVIPTSLRDLFGFRWALRCSTPQASDTVLGSGWASQGFSAAAIDAADRGVGWLLAEGGLPVKCKAFYLSDDQLWAIADRASALRAHADVGGTGRAA